ncbi:coiled-coil domain-containing protein 106-like [Cyprinus carpio]|uniref:Coiled-coil domain-containing protein 106-like n=1 Tax=Cyprinus carpio TaxID=7962 RepID=A0A9R0B3N3_CYPCA|nr:coiled-coil domain-containing protein 106-like [Cyprinus carpio]
MRQNPPDPLSMIDLQPDMDTALTATGTTTKAETLLESTEVSGHLNYRFDRQKSHNEMLSDIYDGEKSCTRTIQIQFQNAKQTIEVQKQKILHLEDKVNSLTEERNYLRARLEDGKLPSSQSHCTLHQCFGTFAGPSEGVPTQTATTRKSSTSESSNFSTSESSDSKPPKQQKKERVKEKHRAKRHKKSKKLTSDYSNREKFVYFIFSVHTPEESLKRYYKVLNLVKQGLSKAEAYNRLNVDRNTIVIQAPIAELAAANPESFRKLRQMFKKGDSILKFAASCLCLCKEKANEDVIKQMKEANDLLDINKK